MRMARRVVRDRGAVLKLFDEIAPRFVGRAGGYTRIVKLGQRPGDAAPMSLLELMPDDGGVRPQARVLQGRRPRAKGAAKAETKAAGKAEAKGAKGAKPAAEAVKKAAAAKASPRARRQVARQVDFRPGRRPGALQFRRSSCRTVWERGRLGLADATKERIAWTPARGPKWRRTSSMFGPRSDSTSRSRSISRAITTSTPGLTQNISSGGVFIATSAIRKIGDRITLKFSLPGSAETLAVETEVRWIRENSALHKVDGATGMGVRFVNLSPAAAAAIQKFVESRDSLYYDDE